MEGPRFMELTERACEWKERCEAALLSVKRLERDLNDAKKLEEMNDPRAIDERSMNDPRAINDAKKLEEMNDPRTIILEEMNEERCSSQ